MPEPVASGLSCIDWCSADGSNFEEPLCADQPSPAPVNPSSASPDEDETRAGAKVLVATFGTQGDQFEANVGLSPVEAQATRGNVHLSGRFDFLNANAHLGVQNGDGSKGENIGAMATAVGVEGSVEHSGWSLTAGLSLSLGASVSSGEARDVDHDGVPERCFQVSFGALTLGECDEF